MSHGKSLGRESEKAVVIIDMVTMNAEEEVVAIDLLVRDVARHTDTGNH